ncbi:hypothetical protein C8Q75DRAFT_737331 [Abortiporus biennis]|nr:hypothetical protein C8Q75DRAFT_737331 [Abortiporus biennis]
MARNANTVLVLPDTHRACVGSFHKLRRTNMKMAAVLRFLPHASQYILLSSPHSLEHRGSKHFLLEMEGNTLYLAKLCDTQIARDRREGNSQSIIWAIPCGRLNSSVSSLLICLPLNTPVYAIEERRHTVQNILEIPIPEDCISEYSNGCSTALRSIAWTY